MDDTMKQFQEKLIEIEAEAEALLLARHQLVENDRMRNGNREALTALRKRSRTTKTSVPSPYEFVMKEIDQSRPLVKEICATCGNHDSKEKTWMMFPGTDIFARVPFHAAHTILEKGDFVDSTTISWRKQPSEAGIAKAVFIPIRILYQSLKTSKKTLCVYRQIGYSHNHAYLED
ncbi:uncharacterized protein LOC112522798 isoform X1 [Cynara cardunculus var. scolymus]|uniref:uncharacterized protein LOC112522798 isoform X1 n=2 Tax=Cynara cardunculus var. scolymus TaxID=59895 RepID=UPI000D629FC0|nr:uncharacterized protein LOC112522798 isoform X1 [Cynara cardunculus var. scolymus]